MHSFSRAQCPLTRLRDEHHVPHIVLIKQLFAQFVAGAVRKHFTLIVPADLFVRHAKVVRGAGDNSAVMHSCQQHAERGWAKDARTRFDVLPDEGLYGSHPREIAAVDRLRGFRLVEEIGPGVLRIAADAICAEGNHKQRGNTPRRKAPSIGGCSCNMIFEPLIDHGNRAAADRDSQKQAKNKFHPRDDPVFTQQFEQEVIQRWNPEDCGGDEKDTCEKSNFSTTILEGEDK